MSIQGAHKTTIHSARKTLKNLLEFAGPERRASIRGARSLGRLRSFLILFSSDKSQQIKCTSIRLSGKLLDKLHGKAQNNVSLPAEVVSGPDLGDLCLMSRIAVSSMCDMSSVPGGAFAVEGRKMLY